MAFGKIFVAAAIMLAGLTAVSAEDFNGRWQSEFDSQLGTQKYVYDFKVAGEKLTGKAIRDTGGEKAETEISDGKVKGVDISFSEMRKIMDMDVKIEYEGKIKGDEIKLTRKVGDFASYEIVAKRSSPVAGKWLAEFDSQLGAQKYVYDFKVEGDKLTGKAHRELNGEKSETDIKEGKVKGDDVTFVEVLKNMDMDLKIEYSGKIKGDEIKLTRKVGDLATYEITAKRSKESETKAIAKGDKGGDKKAPTK